LKIIILIVPDIRQTFLPVEIVLLPEAGLLVGKKNPVVKTTGFFSKKRNLY
jgi:hypothetical protein